ncbi:MAG: U32 family peptidase [Oscillospiraceae bacterium]|nr:U32 family peptidase [Oscillospiraceae bacterium]
MIELLAPAGSMEALRAAVQNGANAVYLGCGSFNARQSAKNFTIQTLSEAVKYCHVRGVQVHLTLNTLVSDREMDACCELIRNAAAAGVDAFIVQDLGVVELCRQIAPKVPIHGSTQMTVHSLPGVLFCAAMGMTRVVLSRELSREEIRAICAQSPIEIEVFAHGALCMCYSGQCYLSAAIGGRSGNRGRCAQPCRLPYGFGRSEHKYPLSLKDNCLVHYVKDLEEMGVASLKLEGRMKKPEYVATVTRVYRQALDEGNVTRSMEKALHDAFNRQGFTDGYYTGEIGPQMFGIRDDKTEDAAWAKAARESYEAVENGLVPVVFRAIITERRCELTVRDPDGNICKAQGELPQMARTRPLLAEDLAARLAKTGGTPFRCADVVCKIEPGFTLSAAAINAMRRDVLTQLMAVRARRESPQLGRPRKVRDVFGRREEPGLTVQITTREQITGRLLNMGLQLLYVPLHLLTEDPDYFRYLIREGLPVAAVLPRIVHDGELEALKNDLRTVRGIGVREALVGNLGLLIPVRECGLEIRGDFGLNIFNSRAMEVCRRLEMASATVSFEMTLPQIRDVSKCVDTELLIYGRMPLMVTENCIMRNRTGSCVCQQGPQRLVDRTGAEFPIIKDGRSCRSVLLNGKKLSLIDRREDLSRLGLWGLRLYFTTENGREVDRVLRDFLNGAPFEPGSCTRGLYLRGLD